MDATTEEAPKRLFRLKMKVLPLSPKLRQCCQLCQRNCHIQFLQNKDTFKKVSKVACLLKIEIISDKVEKTA